MMGKESEKGNKPKPEDWGPLVVAVEKVAEKVEAVAAYVEAHPEPPVVKVEKSAK